MPHPTANSQSASRGVRIGPMPGPVNTRLGNTWRDWVSRLAKPSADAQLRPDVGRSILISRIQN